MFDTKIRNVRRVYASNSVNLFNQLVLVQMTRCNVQLEWKSRKTRGQGLCEDQGEDVGRERVVYNANIFCFLGNDRRTRFFSSSNVRQYVSPKSVRVATVVSVRYRCGNSCRIVGWFDRSIRRTDNSNIRLSFETSIGIAIGRSRSKFISQGISRLYFLRDNRLPMSRVQNVLLEHVTSIPYFYSLASCIFLSSSFE